jgi:CHAT domain-containing protein/Tfp pilus assembly protein PilF
VAQDAEDPGTELVERIGELRAEGSYEEALEAARELADVTRRDPDSMPHDVFNAERLVETLEGVVGLSPDARGSLAAADSLAQVGRTLWAESMFAEGIEAAERELAIRREILGDDHPEVVTATNNLAALLHQQGDLDRAEPLYLEALEGSRRILGENHPDVATTLNNLASLRYVRGDYSGAEAFLRDALASFSEIYGEEHPQATSSLLNLASVLKAGGRYADAEVLYRRALAIRREVHGDEHRDVAESMGALASVLKARGDYAAAEPLYREALAMRRRLLGEDHLAVASGLNGLASCLEAQGDYAGAEALFREALALRRRRLGPEHHLVAQTLNNLAATLYRQDDYAGARPLYRHALEIRRKALGEEHPLTASSMYNLAVLLKAQEDYDGAKALFRDALAIRRRALGEQHPSIAYSLQNLGVLLYELGEYADAESYFSEALTMRRTLLGEEHPHVAVTLKSFALLLKAERDYASAEPILEEACAIYDAARLRAGTGISRATFLDCPYADLAQAKLVLGKEREAWSIAERALARTLSDFLIASEGRDLTSEEIEREEALKQELADLEREVATYRQAAVSDSSDEARERFHDTRNRLLEQEAAWGVFQRTMAAKYPVTEGQIYALDRVQTALEEREAIVGWLDVETAKGSFDSWGYVVRRDEPVAWAHLPAGDGSSPFTRLIRFREQLADPATASVALRIAGREVWTERLEPLAHALGGVEQLTVIPSGAMLGVPLETAIDGEERYVGDRFTVSYVPSATIAAWLSEGALGSAPSGALLVGDPPFVEAHSGPSVDEPREPSVSALGAAGTRHRQARDALRALPRLPGTRREVMALAEILPGATVLLGEDASEQGLVRLAEERRLADYRMIHLATHAHIDDTRPGLSSLILSQVGLPDPLDAAVRGDRIYDGLLTAKEIVREWELDADLVTLSACETALGREAGGEGYIGLAHAFFQAGARSLLVSLWKVEDRAASLLMRRFYENRTGSYDDERAGLVSEAMSKSAALQEAKRWLRGFTDEGGLTPYAEPFYWSAFVLLGEQS